MTKTTALPWWNALFDDHTVDLSVVGHNCGECSHCLRAAGTTLKRVQYVLQSVVDIVNRLRAAIEVKLHANLKSIGGGVNDSLLPLHGHDRGVKIAAPSVSRRSIGWHSNMQSFAGLRHRDLYLRHAERIISYPAGPCKKRVATSETGPPGKTG
jgi:hypothetical protein